MSIPLTTRLTMQPTARRKLRLDSGLDKRLTARRITARAALAALLALPVIAFAQVQAYTNQPINLMAGPGGDYPVVAGLAPNQPVEVMGCISTYEWCDVALDDLRGWVYGAALTYPYEGAYVPLQSYGAVIGLPVVVFSIDSYWDRYYHGRPWYGERDRWRYEGPHPYAPQPHGNEPYPAQGPGQPVYRPQPSPQPQQAGRPFQPLAPQAQTQRATQPQQPGRPFQPTQPQQMARPPVQAQPQQHAQPQAQPQSRPAPNEGHREPPQNP